MLFFKAPEINKYWSDRNESKCGNEVFGNGSLNDGQGEGKVDTYRCFVPLLQFTDCLKKRICATSMLTDSHS